MVRLGLVLKGKASPVTGRLFFVGAGCSSILANVLVLLCFYVSVPVVYQPKA
jgi:hypothetical protein